MISVTEIVKEGILEISFSDLVDTLKIYQIKNSKEEVVLTGKIIGNTQRSYRDWETDRKSTRLNSSHLKLSRMPSSA